MSQEIENIAKAIEESAKFGQKTIELIEGLGSFISDVIKEPITDTIGMFITDKIKLMRWNKLLKMSEEVKQILDEKKIKATRAVLPKFVLPIFENASLEDDPNLEYLWSHLLANAMNPEFNDEIRYCYIDMIKNITGIEAKILNNMYFYLQSMNKLKPLYKVYNYSIPNENTLFELNIDSDTYALSINNLIRLQLVTSSSVDGGNIDETNVIIFSSGIDSISITPMGVKFVEACIH